MLEMDKISFEEAADYPSSGVTTLFFTGPKELLHGQYPEAISAEISLEFPSQTKGLDSISAMISPTRETEDGTEDYDWSDYELEDSELVGLLHMAGYLERLEITQKQAPLSGPSMTTLC